MHFRFAHFARWLLFALIVTQCSISVSAQYFRASSYWKTERRELSVGMGVSNFLGELGGRNQTGSPFLWDLEVSQTRPAAHFDLRYFIAEKMAVRARLTYCVLAGNDNLTTEIYRRNRNLSFKSDIYEASLVYEFHPFREELGHMHDLRGVQGKKSARMGLYVFAGVGVFYFDPKTQFQNAWVRLKPLATEGQGLEGGPATYNNLQVCLPMGMGLRKALSKQLSTGIEFQYTKTFTDYIDDVSTEYFDNDIILAANGDVAAYLADPSLEESGLNTTNTGQQRGDPKDLDTYLLFTVQMHYKLIRYKSTSKKYRTRIHRQKIVF